jgi:L-ascorbate metabolism protein UlaG (beta-lactamase superfamily)
MSAALTVTRVVNACVLLELGGAAVLTDPYFDSRWFIRLREPIGMKVQDLPRLSAIIGGHGVFDHWQPRSLEAYPYKQETPVFVATRSMMRKALAAGFRRAEVLPWHAMRSVSERLTLEVAPAQTSGGMKVNSYVLTTDDVRVFIGTEARDLDPIRLYRKQRPSVDVALLPIDGSAIMRHKLVMNATDALEGSRILGARILIPIHYALKPVPLLFQTPSSREDLLRVTQAVSDPTVVVLEPGRRWSLLETETAARSVQH